MGIESVGEVIKSATEPVTKLMESVAKAIGKVYEPRHIKKIAEAEAYRIEKISDAIRNNCDLPIIYKAQEQTVAIDTTSCDELKERAGSRLAYQEIKKQQNIESVVEKTALILEQETSVSEEKVNDDWMTRFINSIEDISDEEMQSLWAKILAGEIKQPKTCSLRTLDVVRNLSSEEIKLFQKISSLIFNGFIFDDVDFLKKHGVFYSDILKLDDCGLINTTSSIYNLKISQSKTILFKDNDYVIIGEITDINNTDTHPINITVYVLTEPAKNLIKFTNNNDNPEIVIEMGKIIKKENRNKNVKISVHKIKQIENNEVDFEETDLIELDDRK